MDTASTTRAAAIERRAMRRFEEGQGQASPRRKTGDHVKVTIPPAPVVPPEPPADFDPRPQSGLAKTVHLPPKPCSSCDRRPSPDPLDAALDACDGDVELLDPDSHEGELCPRCKAELNQEGDCPVCDPWPEDDFEDD